MEQEITNVNSIGLGFTILMCIFLLLLPQRYAILPMILISLYMTFGQVVTIAGVHFSMLRIVIFSGLIRLIARGELLKVRLNVVDKTVVIWVISSVILYTLLVKTYDAFIYVSGFAYNTIGLYFFFRGVVRDFNDVSRSVKMLGFVIVPLAILMIIENMTGRNLFSFFGGVPEFTAVRDGRLRCTGPFRHAILAGTFGATAMPLMVSLYFRQKFLGFAGFCAATIIAFVSASSGPVAAYILTIVALLLWPFRSYMRAIKWGLFAGLLMLHAIMKAPVWYLMARVSEIIGGTGWHRSALIDAAIRYFDEWWLLGTAYTAHWMPYTLRRDATMADITNQFIWEGVNGGLVRMLLFTAIIVLSYQALGRAMKFAKERAASMEMLLLCMGCYLFAYVASFFSVSYFDQIAVFWFLLLAMISANRDLVDGSITLT